METVNTIVVTVIYVALGLIAVWGAFCVILIWRRVAQVRFRNEEEQAEFLDELDGKLAAGDFDSAAVLCDEDDRAMPQLAQLALSNRRLGYAKTRSLVADRFQRDVLSDLEYRLSWVYAVIKSAPMVGLLGTVIGMMGAFAQLAAPKAEAAGAAVEVEKTDATSLAGNISLALITTASGLAIAIPLVLATASINVRIRKMEDLVGAGLTRFFETFRLALDQSPAPET